MLYQLHLGHQVGAFYQPLWGVSSCDDDVHTVLPLLAGEGGRQLSSFDIHVKPSPEVPRWRRCPAWSAARRSRSNLAPVCRMNCELTDAKVPAPGCGRSTPRAAVVMPLPSPVLTITSPCRTLRCFTSSAGRSPLSGSLTLHLPRTAAAPFLPEAAHALDLMPRRASFTFGECPSAGPMRLTARAPVTGSR